MRVTDHGSNEAVFHGDGKRDVRGAVTTDMRGFPGGVDRRHAAQGVGAGLENEVVDGEFDAFFFQSGIELLTERQERASIHLDIEVDVGDLRSGLEHTLGDDAAHRGYRNETFFLHGAAGREGAAGERASRSGFRGRRVLFRSQDVGADDASAGAGSVDESDIDLLFRGEFPGERRYAHAATRRSGHRGKRSRGRRGRHGRGFRLVGARRHGSGRSDRSSDGRCRGLGRRRGDDFAGLTDRTERVADGDLCPGGGKYLQQRSGEETLQLHRRFVRFNLGEHITGIDYVAFLFQPFDQRAHRHGVAEFRHVDELSHGKERSEKWVARSGALNPVSVRAGSRHCGEHGFDDASRVRELFCFHRRAVDRRRVDGGEPVDWTVEVVEGFTLNHVGKLRPDAREGFLFFDDEDTIRFLDRGENGIEIERTNRTEVNDLD